MRKRSTRGALLAAGLAVLALATARPVAAQTVATRPADWSAVISRSVLTGTYEEGEIHSVDFLDRHEGWAVGGHGNATMIFHTSDGGQTWNRLTLYDGQEHEPMFTAVRFADANNGWIVGDRDVLRTTDGGETWDPLDLPGTVGGLFAHALLVLGPNAVMIGRNSSNGDQIWTTTNGGASWQRHSVTSSANDDVHGLAFVAPDRFFAVTGSDLLDHGAIFLSRDGGGSWQDVAEGTKQLHGIDFSPDGHGIAVGDHVAYWSDDSGDTWHRVPMPGEHWSVRMLDDTHAVAVGVEPSLLLSEDGGRTWRPGPGPNTTGRLVDIAMVDPGWFFVAGAYSANALFRYDDPDYVAVLATTNGRLPKPLNVDGKRLPPGAYQIVFGHRELDHVLLLRLVQPDSGIATGVAQPSAPNQYACNPCAAVLPVDAAEEKVDGGGDAVHFSLEPTPDGLSIVADIVVAGSRAVAAGVAALSLSDDGQVRAPQAVANVKKKGGGLFGRLKKAANGDLRGAVEGADPEAVSHRVRAVQAAHAAPPGIYRLRLTYPLHIITGSPGGGS